MTEDDLDAHFGAGQWRGLVRFALWQHDKWRLVDDASVGHNATFAASEQIHTTSATAAASLTKAFRDTHGKALRRHFQLKGASCDMKSAYKQLAINPDQLRYVVIAVFSPSARALGVRYLLRTSVWPCGRGAPIQ